MVRTGHLLYKTNRAQGLQPGAAGGPSWAMPFCEEAIVDQRKRFVLEAMKARIPFSQLCREFDISRPTGYKWLQRYDQGGAPALENRSTAPRRHPNQIPDCIERMILAARDELDYGPRKIRGVLRDRHPGRRFPALSTISEILRRHGRAAPQKKRRRTPPSTQPFAAVSESNQLWCADYKGPFHTADGARINPLTISDCHSRYLLRVQIVERMDTAEARGVFQAAFREFGLPQAIRTDNGAPFASPAPAGLSRLSVEWVRRGIRPERIEPGKPQQNGRHERMHRTLKQETTRPPAATKRKQQRLFHEFQRRYNELRPHEALDDRPPASVYQSSSRIYRARLPEIEYPAGYLLRRISGQGSLKWEGERSYVTEVLGHELVGLEPIDERYYEVWFSFLPLGRLDTYRKRFEPHRGKRKGKRK